MSMSARRVICCRSLDGTLDIEFGGVVGGTKRQSYPARRQTIGMHPGEVRAGAD